MARVNKGSRSFTCHPHVYPQVEWSIPALTLSCRVSLHSGWYSLPSCWGWRLSWPGWLGEILRWFAHPKTVIHPSICRSSQELNLWLANRKSNALATRPPCHLTRLVTHLNLVHEFHCWQCCLPWQPLCHRQCTITAMPSSTPHSTIHTMTK